MRSARRSRTGLRASAGPAVRAILLACAVALLLAACLPPQASFRPGFSTSVIDGAVDNPPLRKNVPPPFLLVVQHHYTFVELEGQPAVTHPSAHVRNLDAGGRFRVDLPADVVGADLYFIAADHLTEVFRFHRQFGVGTVSYHASLQPMNDWRAHFYTFLKPQLEHFITEDRYRLNPIAQQQLSDWMEDQQQRIEARRALSAR